MPVKITTLIIQQFKRIKAVSFTPAQDGLTSIGGKNRAGKTSVLDAIAYMLGGAAMRPSDPKNRDSQKQPYLRADLSNGLTVERKGKNGSLKVSGSEDGTGQGVLDLVIEKLALNLPKFLQATAKVKAKTLLKIIGVGDKLQALDDAEKVAYDERRIIGRDVDRMAIELKAMPWHEDLPEELELQSVAEIIRDIEKIHSDQIEIERMGARAQEERDAAIRCDEQIGELRSKLKELRASLNFHSDTADKIESTISKTIIPEIEPLTIKLEGAEAYNVRVRENEAYTDKRLKLAGKQDAHMKLEGQIESVRHDRNELLDSVEMPLEGLTIVEGELVYNGDHWDCMSGSDQLKVSASIVREINPECGFVLLDKTEQMDLDTLREFGEWAESTGLQILATRVGAGDENTLIIENGEVAG